VSRSVLIPLVNGDELVVAHRHTGGLLLALRSGKAGHFRVQSLGVIAAEDVQQLREFLAPGAAPTPARSDSHIITLTEVTHWHATTPAEVARHNPGAVATPPQPEEDRAALIARLQLAEQFAQEDGRSEINNEDLARAAEARTQPSTKHQAPSTVPAPIWQPTPPAPVTGGDIICSVLFFAGLFALLFLS
jgi:hypothetical protein